MRRLPIVLCFAFVLSACGGGGNSGPAIPATSPVNGAQNGAVSGASPLTLPHSYTVIDLGAFAQPAAINNLNDVAGTIDSNPSTPHAFIYRAGVTTAFAAPSHAVAINDSDLAVGDGSAYKPDGTVINLGSVASGITSEALGVDDSGKIAGLSILEGVAGCGGGLTLFSTAGPPTNIGDSSNTLAVSHSGKIVLDGYTKSGAGCTGTIAPFYYPSLTTVPLPSGLTLDVNASAVAGVNDAGDVIGYSQKSNASGPSVTFFAHGGTATEIDPAAGYDALNGLGINSADWIVGFEHKSSGARAIIWVNGTTTDLNTLLSAGCSGWVLQNATGVNDNGYITGVGTLNGATHGYLLVPQH